MSAPNPALAALRDIHLPEAVSLWPLAPGWWALAGLLVAAAAAIALLRRARRKSAKRAALRLLAGAERDFERDGDAQALAATLSALLRRVALARFPRRDVAALHGRARLGLLSGAGAGSGFDAAVLDSLEAALYGAADADSATAAGSRDADAQTWIAAARAWIRRTA